MNLEACILPRGSQDYKQLGKDYGCVVAEMTWPGAVHDLRKGGKVKIGQVVSAPVAYRDVGKEWHESQYEFSATVRMTVMARDNPHLLYRGGIPVNGGMHVLLDPTQKATHGWAEGLKPYEALAVALSECTAMHLTDWIHFDTCGNWKTIGGIDIDLPKWGQEFEAFKVQLHERIPAYVPFVFNSIGPEPRLGPTLDFPGRKIGYKAEAALITGRGHRKELSDWLNDWIEHGLSDVSVWCMMPKQRWTEDELARYLNMACGIYMLTVLDDGAGPWWSAQEYTNGQPFNLPGTLVGRRWWRFLRNMNPVGQTYYVGPKTMPGSWMCRLFWNENGLWSLGVDVVAGEVWWSWIGKDSVTNAMANPMR